MKNEIPVLLLIPSPIQENQLDAIPPEVKAAVMQIKVFVVEKIRTSRRFLRKIAPDLNIDKLEFIQMDKKGDYLFSQELSEIFQHRKNFALMSEAGLPCIADPGLELVRKARREGYKISPLSGPSSIMLALMASGLNGQSFHFHGYLPIPSDQLIRKLKIVERDLKSSGASQIFIETPYRNARLIETILKTLDSDLIMSIAIDIGGPGECIDSKDLASWKRGSTKSFEIKAPAVFILGLQ